MQRAVVPLDRWCEAQRIPVTTQRIHCTILLVFIAVIRLSREVDSCVTDIEGIVSISFAPFFEELR